MTANNAIERLTVEQLRADQNWWRIYEDSFPASEREPREVILESVRRGVGMALRSLRDEAAGDKRGAVTSGLATTHLLMDPPAVFLIYLAVDPGERSRGIGAGLLRYAWELGAAEIRGRGLNPLGLVWEIDPPQPDASDAAARLRRVAFFEKHGGRIVGRSYLQPPVDGVAPVPMSLMIRPAEGETLPAEAKVDALVRAIYFEKYGAINGIGRTVLEELLKTTATRG
jgi:GNAT superfamily N-acetyltransferase